MGPNIVIRNGKIVRKVVWIEYYLQLNLTYGRYLYFAINNTDKKSIEIKPNLYLVGGFKKQKFNVFREILTHLKNEATKGGYIRKSKFACYLGNKIYLRQTKNNQVLDACSSSITIFVEGLVREKVKSRDSRSKCFNLSLFSF